MSLMLCLVNWIYLLDNNSLFKAIRELKNNKSEGPDLYINEIFIHGKHVLAPFLLSLFSKIFEIGYFPTRWSEGYIVPLHKKGTTTDVNHYRGITLLSKTNSKQPVNGMGRKVYSQLKIYTKRKKASKKQI